MSKRCYHLCKIRVTTEIRFENTFINSKNVDQNSLRKTERNNKNRYLKKKLYKKPRKPKKKRIKKKIKERRKYK